MAKKREIAYEPHPVSPERKRELLDKGFKIIDARFAPAGYVPALPALGDGEHAETRKSSGVLQPANESPDHAGDGLNDMDAEQLHALAKERGVSVHHKAGADKVREALRQAN